MVMRPLRAAKDVLRDWLPELSVRLGRSIEALEARGLSAHDFGGDRSVEIRYPYGHVHRMALSFAVVKPKAGLAAVFSEHAGYVEFELVEDTVVVEVIDEIVYRHEPEELDG